MPSDDARIQNLLSRNVHDVIDRDHLRAALASGKKLRVKLGIDPTGERIHIGRAIVLWKLREFQDIGHTIVLIIGDFTAQIGDPSDKLEKRPFLSQEQVEANMKNYLPQIGKIVDLKKVEVHYNSEWLAELNFREISQLADMFTFQQILERRNFADRLRKGQEISYREGLYPLMQGYDSVAVKADVEIGGSDQLFNLLAGRKLQEQYGQKPQDILTTKMIVGLDGRKMSTSWGNVINIADDPAEQFGKVMSLRDGLIGEYAETAAGFPMERVRAIRAELAPRGLARWFGAGGKNTRFKEIKEELAFAIVRRYHGEEKARAARARFEQIFSRHEIPSDLPELALRADELSALDLVLASGAAKSKSDARRIIEQGGFDFDGKTTANPQEVLKIRGGAVIKIGKKRFFRVIH